MSAARLGANGSHVPQTSSVFSIEVYPEDHSEPQSVRAASPDPGEVVSSVCAADEPVTVLTVILDADLTKMIPKQRLDLLQRMQSFSEVELHNMKLVPVVNNRLFDMSAFMAGPGNAKKVIENGALLSWKLGCSLNQNSVPDIHGVEVPAREGAMSAQLGYPVVGWHIANKKPLSQNASGGRSMPHPHLSLPLGPQPQPSRSHLPGLFPPPHLQPLLLQLRPWLPQLGILFLGSPQSPFGLEVPFFRPQLSAPFSPLGCQKQAPQSLAISAQQ